MAPVRRPEKKCPHGRRQDRCRDCCGASFCAHGSVPQVRRSSCAPCCAWWGARWTGASTSVASCRALRAAPGRTSCCATASRESGLLHTAAATGAEQRRRLQRPLRNVTVRCQDALAYLRALPSQVCCQRRIGAAILCPTQDCQARTWQLEIRLRCGARSDFRLRWR